MSDTTLMITLTVGWLLFQYGLPLALSYYYLSRDEERERALGRDPLFAYHHHTPMHA